MNDKSDNFNINSNEDSEKNDVVLRKYLLEKIYNIEDKHIFDIVFEKYPVDEIQDIGNSEKINTNIREEYILKKIISIMDAFAIKANNDNKWIGFCNYCGVINLNNYKAQFDFFTHHKKLCWLLNKKTNIEINFLKCEIGG